MTGRPYLITIVAITGHVCVCRAEYEELQLSMAHPSNSPATAALPLPSFNWDFGEVRGGTAAHLVRPDLYLGFFHSKWTLPGSRFVSYFFGAYAFDTQPPFKLKAMSR